MFSKNTKISSQGEKIKKFRMPTFPSALVITFFVLFFVVLLSWIPHKGWVDAGNPLFYLNQDGFYTSDGIQLATWSSYSGLVENKITENSVLILQLTNEGFSIFENWLLSCGFSTNDAFAIANEAQQNGIYITNINLDNDWSKASINYSGLSFDLHIGGDEAFLLSASIEIDKIFASQIVTENSEGEIVFVFNILSGEIISLSGSKIGEVTLDESFGFASANIADDWFNFKGTNYYLGDDQGRFGVLNIPFVLVAGLFSSTGVILYLFCIGAFVEVMLQSGALEAGTSSLVKKMHGKELLLIPILFTLFCIGGTAFGMQEETLGLIPLIIPFLVLAGFDTMTGLLIIVVGTTAGISASVLDPFSVGVMSSSLTGEIIPESAEVAPNAGIVIRIIMFLAFVLAGSTFCTWYGHRSRKGKDFVAEPEMFEQNQQWAHEMLGEAHANHTGLTKRQGIGLAIFGATFGLMAFSLLPWIEWFPGLAQNNGWTTFSSLFFAKALFGEWYFIQLSFMFLLVALILGRVFGMKQKDTNKAIYNGMKGMVGLGVILTVSRGVEIVLGYSGLTIDMVAMMFSGSGDGNFGPVGLAWILFPMFAFLASFISSTSGLAAITGPIIAPMLWQLSIIQNPTDPEAMFAIYAIVVMVTYPLAQGTINMFMPTTGLVIAQAEVAKVNFGKALPILGIAALGTAIIGMTIITIAIPLL